MTSVNTLESLFEPLSWKGVCHLFQEWLIRWFASSQGEEAELICIEIDLGADKAMGPVLMDSEGVSQDTDTAFFVGSPQVNDLALRMFLQVQPPALGKRSPRRCRLDPCRNALPSGHDVFGRSGL